MSTELAAEKPVALLVNVEIDPSRLDEFREVMEIDARGSVTNENGGCLAFDVLELGDNKFMFYEVYKNEAAVEFHKSTEHFKKWTDFKATGAVLSQTVTKPTAFMLGSKKF